MTERKPATLVQAPCGKMIAPQGRKLHVASCQLCREALSSNSDRPTHAAGAPASAAPEPSAQPSLGTSPTPGSSSAAPTAEPGAPGSSAIGPEGVEVLGGARDERAAPPAPPAPEIRTRTQPLDVKSVMRGTVRQADQVASDLMGVSHAQSEQLDAMGETAAPVGEFLFVRAGIFGVLLLAVFQFGLWWLSKVAERRRMLAQRLPAAPPRPAPAPAATRAPLQLVDDETKLPAHQPWVE